MLTTSTSRHEQAALGLRLAHDKTRHWTPQRRAELAGVVLAAKPTIRAEYVDSVGRLIHRLEHRRVLVSPPDIESLWGKIGWIEALRPVAGRKLRERLRRALKSPCAVGPTLSMELANQSGAA